ncbi:MAG: dipeptide epimerase, partial [Chthonomonadales bacterium]|nr:dipeptide epimerase [Chthonomonadales bacterium]
RRRGAHAINIKLMKTRIVEGFAIAQLARAAGLRLMMGAMVETILALSAAAHIAAGSGLFDFIDLDTQFFVAGDVMRSRILRPNGVLDLRGVRAGLGVTPVRKTGTRRDR